MSPRMHKIRNILLENRSIYSIISIRKYELVYYYQYVMVCSIAHSIIDNNNYYRYLTLSVNSIISMRYERKKSFKIKFKQYLYVWWMMDTMQYAATMIHFWPEELDKYAHICVQCRCNRNISCLWLRDKGKKQMSKWNRVIHTVDPTFYSNNRVELVWRLYIQRFVVGEINVRM